MVTEFVFSGFLQLQTSGLLYFFTLLFIYIFIMAGNLMIFFAVRLDTRLHNPMYNFISIFSFLEMWYSTATIPKMLSNLISQHKTISFAGCLLQVYFFHSLRNTEGTLLTVMAIDRYVAICHPLCYPKIMTPRLCAQLTAGSCIFGFLFLLPEIVWISSLTFCGPNQIHKIFCDFTFLLKLACTDASVILVQDVIHALAILITSLIISLSYVRIIVVILSILSTEVCKKAFSTCPAHIAVFLLFFGSVTLMYLRFSATYTPFWDNTIALTFSVFAPLFNPIIYSLRNKDMKDAIKKLFCPQKVINESGGAERQLVWIDETTLKLESEAGQRRGLVEGDKEDWGDDHLEFTADDENVAEEEENDRDKTNNEETLKDIVT
ncbi:olfactory receptor 6K3-like [Arvicola amphibius]|uniref:olfactory receptor 6K3-like n=1 Tax=Arvicola amphibius TaxID=1047088 RepID=UPI0018E2DF33|nr:olfactory receptor 6K3-like [Arvicola amphibius]